MPIKYATNSELIPLPLYLPPDQWQVVATRSIDATKDECVFHYELQFDGYCICDHNVALSLSFLAQAHGIADGFADSLHKAALRALLHGLGPAIAKQIQMARETAAEESECPDAGPIDAPASG